MENEYLTSIQALPKSDLHNHAGRGDNISYISRCFQVDITPPQQNFDNLADMQSGFEENVKKHCKGLEGYIKRIEAAFHRSTKSF